MIRGGLIGPEGGGGLRATPLAWGWGGQDRYFRKRGGGFPATPLLVPGWTRCIRVLLPYPGQHRPFPFRKFRHRKFPSEKTRNVSQKCV